MVFFMLPQIAYGLLAAGIVRLLRRFAMLPRARIVVGCLCAGLAAGLLAAWIWPADAAAWLNRPGVVLGDLVYNGSIRLLGDPASAQAHYTVPWILRVPQVYLLVSTGLWGIIGIGIQLYFNRKRT